LKPFVSVIIPCRNEAGFLGACLNSVFASDYPRDRMEVIAADGLSTDGSRELLSAYARTYALRVVDNPAGITPAALNRAIEAARGTVIVRVDAHAAIAPDYISRAVEHLERSNADNVGGPMRTVARDRGPFARAIGIVLAHPFGVGNSHFRTANDDGEARWVDTVFGGCWRREVFDRVGMFNERLARGQDMEFNLRLRRAGGRILLAPDVRSTYFARATFGSFLRHNWTNGVWAMLPFGYSDVVPVKLRHLAPLAFTAALAVAALLALAGFLWPLALVAGPYAVTNFAVSGLLAWRERRVRLLALLPIAFASLHLAYGAGSLWGVGQLMRICGARVLGHSGRETPVEEIAR
jgi:succinoglycan biosynthesis protein ExoA